MEYTEKAYAKLNLSLDISNKRDDGYHDIRSVFTTVSLCDEVSFIKTDGEVSVICDEENLDNQDNICYKAYCEYIKAAKIKKSGAIIKIKKQIPLSAGLGGGSADAGALLRILDRVYGKLSSEKVLEIALKCGADVPFCYLGGIAYVEGVGEKITKIKPLPECKIVIIKQGKKPSTGELYKAFDNSSNKIHPDISKMLEAVEKQDIKEVAKNLGNSFSAIWGEEFLKIKSELLSLGALGSELSGSGPSVFGIFQKGEGEKAYKQLKNKYKDCFLVKPI